MLDYRYETFIMVCKHLNYTKASNELHITQPAVSQHIKYLEEYYQVKLFEYQNKRLKLTKAGNILKNKIITIKNDEMVLKNELVNDNMPMYFGTTKTIGEFLIADKLIKYINNHPNVNIHLKINNTNKLIKELKEGSINFALVEGNFNNEEFDYINYKNERFIIVCNYNHKFEHQVKSVKDLLDERLFIREIGSGTRDILEKYLILKNINLNSFKQINEIGSMHVIVELLKADLGISFMYESAVSELIKNKVLKEVKVEDFKVSHELNFIYNHNSNYEEMYHKICNEIK